MSLENTPVFDALPGCTFPVNRPSIDMKVLGKTKTCRATPDFGYISRPYVIDSRVRQGWEYWNTRDRLNTFTHFIVRAR